MSCLSQQDFELLLSAVNLLNSDSNPNSLSNRTLQSVSLLISNDMVAFDGFGTDGDYSGSLWYSPPETVSQKQIEIFGELVNEHPYFVEILTSPGPKAVKVSDCTSLAKFHNTGLYNEFYKHIGGDTQMAIPLQVSDKLRVICTLLRVKVDFKEREREILNLFAPHLVSAFHNAQFINRLAVEREQLNAALDATKYGVVTVDMDLNVQSQNATAARLLRQYFQHAHNLPEELSRYLEYSRHTFVNNEYWLPPPMLEIKQQNSKLKIRLAFHSQLQIIILLMEEFREPSPSDLIKLGLTRREADVLFCMTQGKTNIEIGAICGISWRTVHKHTEHIFDKLGVETRTAAVIRAMESF